MLGRVACVAREQEPGFTLTKALPGGFTRTWRSLARQAQTPLLTLRAPFSWWRRARTKPSRGLEKIQTKDERDAEAKKRAVDVDADDSDEPEAKRPARRKRRQ